MRELQDFIEALGEEVQDVDEGTQMHYEPVAGYTDKNLQKHSMFSPERNRPRTWAW